MASMVEITCKCGCKRKKMVRTADVKRGWGKFYSKSCKAREQEKRTGQNRKYIGRQSNSYDDDWKQYDDECGWDAHKDTF